MLPRIFDGSGKPAPDRLLLRAGQLTLQYEAGMVRYVRLGTIEVLRAIYAAVRDRNWGTVPGELRDVQLEQFTDSFRLSFVSDHQQGTVHFRWSGVITGTADSTLTFEFDGEALTAFQRNRIGFCVLHPMDLAGVPLTIEHTDGSLTESVFPRDIAPHQPFFDIRAITHHVAPGLRAETRMEGDAFEMEDQRNWIDASFKTYCTPLGLPFPVALEAGTRVRQSVTLRMIGSAPAVETQDTSHTIRVSSTPAATLPPIGFAVASHGDGLTPREIERLKALHPAHLRVDLRLDGSAAAALDHAWVQAQAVGADLEIAVHLSTGDRATDLAYVRDLIESRGLRGAIIVLRDGELAASPETIAAGVRALAGLPLALGTGTNGYFTQLNRIRPDVSMLSDVERRNLQFVAYSVNPQVHAFDNASLVETLPVIRETVHSARGFSPVPTIAVSPVTFKIRWNPDATAPEGPTPTGQLPRQVDVRQMSLFGAGWTVGALASLGSAGCCSLTFFETTGWLGVMEREAGSSLPELFPSTAGAVFPMYHVFADTAEFAGGDVLQCTVSHPLELSALALRSGTRVRVLVANHTAESASVTLDGIVGSAMVKQLDETSAQMATIDPERFRREPGHAASASAAGLHLELLPYAIARIDLDGTS
ncbi:MAG: hypothetical protein IPM16_10310 [Chloroflexi bacterium]|nr:hypothetical protein [Chloroflexota bacterium]